MFAIPVARPGVWAVEPTAMLGLSLVSPRAAAEWAARTRPVARQTVGRVAIVRLGGLMTKAGGFDAPGTAEVRDEVRRAAADPNVAGLLLAVDSPGGEVAGVADLAAEVRAAAARMPVWAHVDDLCASAAYWVASQCRQVWANSATALVGSIGTYLTLYDVSGKADKDGVKALHFATGPLKGAAAPGTEVTADQKAYFQGIVDAGQASFDAAVKAGRHLSDAQLAAVKSGGVFPARAAIRLGLVDGIQSFDQTLAQLQASAARAAARA